MSAVRDPSITDAEAPWLASYDLRRHLELVDLVVDLGYSNAIASGLATWVATKATAGVDRTTAKTRSRYRRILEELGPPPRRRGRGVSPNRETPRRLIASGAAA